MGRSILDRLPKAPPCMWWAELPTPVQPWGSSLPWLWVKRDDLSHPRYGGGKIRKLEWLLAEPRFASGPLLSVGAIGSHHLRALAEFLDLQDRRLHALICPQVPTMHAQHNLLRLVELRAELYPMVSRIALPFAWARYRLSPSGGARYMAAGGSEGVGLLGFIQAGLELGEQIERGECPTPKRIYIAAGTAGSVAGLSLGLQMAQVKTSIVAVSSVERIAFNRFMLWRKLRECQNELRRWGFSGALPSGVPVQISYDQLGKGYGVPTQRAYAAIRDAHAQNLSLEVTYTGKCFAQILEREEKPEGDVLFWNTHASNPQWSGPEPGWSWPPEIEAWKASWPAAPEGAQPS